MIKEIAPNIDELLARYSRHDIISSVTESSPTSILTRSKLPKEKEDPIDMIINRIEQLEHKFKFKKDTKSAHNCVHCSFINKQLGSNFSTKQSANKCAWKKFSISVIESID